MTAPTEPGSTVARRSPLALTPQQEAMIAERKLQSAMVQKIRGATWSQQWVQRTEAELIAEYEAQVSAEIAALEAARIAQRIPLDRWREMHRKAGAPYPDHYFPAVDPHAEEFAAADLERERRAVELHHQASTARKEEVAELIEANRAKRPRRTAA